MKKIRWGILSTGDIAHSFAKDLKLIPDAELVAVGSRSQSAADSFGEVHGIPNRYSSYEALAWDKDVDVIYVATPHTLHAENSILCMRAGKAVLCEKAFAINAREAEAMIVQHSERFMGMLRSLDSVNTICDYRKIVTEARDECLQKAIKHLDSGMLPEAVLEYLANALSNRIMHQPSVQLREAGVAGDKALIAAMRQLFELT